MQLELFPGLDTPAPQPAGASQPRLWIKRLVIWERPGELLRELHLRRGLNIVWSPDPGAWLGAGGEAGASGTASGMASRTLSGTASGTVSGTSIGHGAGKTLLCRLLRYCLGEDSFGPDALRARIAARLEQGYVGAELCIGGQDWAVVRSLGKQRRHAARPGVSAEAVLADDSAPGLGPMLEAISREALSAPLDDVLPGNHEQRAWLYALAWLSRDQECRYARLLDWRHGRTDSRSPALRLSRQEAADTLRALVGAMSAPEATLRARRAALEEERLTLGRRIREIEAVMARARDAVARTDQIDGSMLDSGPIGLSALRKQAAAAMEEAEAGLAAGAPAASDRIRELRAALEQVIRARAVAEAQAARAEKLGPMCPVCDVPVAEALARGCGLAQAHDAQPDAGQAALAALAARERKARAALSRAERARDKKRDTQQERWFRSRRLIEQVDDLDRLAGELDQARARIAAVDEETLLLSERQEGLRRRHARVVTRLAALYDQVVRGVAGARARARLDLGGRGIGARIELGGDRETVAMDSLKTLAFDVAALLLAMEGHAPIPAFLVHDSPREADLGLSLYHRLFRFLVEREAGAPEPRFQYIITTTTEPPEELCGPPYLVARLGADAGERLLRRDL